MAQNYAQIRKRLLYKQCKLNIFCRMVFETDRMKLTKNLKYLPFHFKFMELT